MMWKILYLVSTASIVANSFSIGDLLERRPMIDSLECLKCEYSALVDGGPNADLEKDCLHVCGRPDGDLLEPRPKIDDLECMKCELVADFEKDCVHVCGRPDCSDTDPDCYELLDHCTETEVKKICPKTCDSCGVDGDLLERRPKIDDFECMKCQYSALVDGGRNADLEKDCLHVCGRPDGDLLERRPKIDALECLKWGWAYQETCRLIQNMLEIKCLTKTAPPTCKDEFESSHCASDCEKLQDLRAQTCGYCGDGVLFPPKRSFNNID